MKLATNLINSCKQQRITLSEVARRSGVPKQTIHNWTLGRKSINPDQIRAVAQVLEVSVYFLLYGENDPFENKSEEILKEIFSGDVRISVHRIEKKKSIK